MDRVNILNPDGGNTIEQEKVVCYYGSCPMLRRYVCIQRTPCPQSGELSSHRKVQYGNSGQC